MTADLILPDVLDGTAPALQDGLKGILKQNMVVDASAVTRVTTQGLQLLLAAGVSAERAGHSLAVRAPSDALLKAAALLGLSGEHLHFEDATQ